MEAEPGVTACRIWGYHTQIRLLAGSVCGARFSSWRMMAATVQERRPPQHAALLKGLLTHLGSKPFGLQGLTVWLGRASTSLVVVKLELRHRQGATCGNDDMSPVELCAWPWLFSSIGFQFDGILDVTSTGVRRQWAQ
ncbi:hypothetical protein E2562_030975 [Oryza meyeriana var. granulata]|uniref:Uncharacterized protein n=1 Tax=Oryza meyeriana var. granulata TaxID=110450 RepID=A0A6G1ER87_9ORYZ|nr:hypothetical protein E2562_030975 [Oryza meyeriana var. granulata]